MVILRCKFKMRFQVILAIIACSPCLCFGQWGSEEKTKQMMENDRKEMERRDPGLFNPLPTEGKPKALDPKTETDTDTDGKRDNGFDQEEIGGAIGGSFTFLGLLCFFLRVYLRYRQIRQAGEGMGDVCLDLAQAIFSCFRRRPPPPPIDLIEF